MRARLHDSAPPATAAPMESLAREVEIGERGRDLLAPDELGKQVELLRAHPQHPRHRLGLVLGEAAGMRLLAHDQRPSLTSSACPARPGPPARPPPERRPA